jgi:multidrug resistance efflux pump
MGTSNGLTNGQTTTDQGRSRARNRPGDAGRRAPTLSLVLLCAALLAGVVYWITLEQDAASVPDGIYSSTGLLAALEVPVAVPQAGRVVEIAMRNGAMVASGQALMRLTRNDGGEFTVVAPHSGRVDRLVARNGDGLDPGQVVAVITDISTLTMIAPFPGKEGAVIPVGAEARLHFKEFHSTAIPARVVSVVAQDGAGEPIALTRPVTVTVEVADTHNLELKPGLKGRVYVRAREGAPWPARLR